MTPFGVLGATAIPPLNPKGYFYIVFNVYARQITRASTLISAYKGNLVAKVLLFCDLCKCFCEKMQNITKLPQKAFASQVCE